jgi:hypothetical protein
LLNKLEIKQSPPKIISHNLVPNECIMNI